jgi:hypothetical protein
MDHRRKKVYKKNPIKYRFFHPWANKKGGPSNLGGQFATLGANVLAFLLVFIGFLFPNVY